MRSLLVTILAAGALLGGCLDAVPEVPADFVDLPDASVADAGCTADTDCPAAVLNGCKPSFRVCVNGVCGYRAAKSPDEALAVYGRCEAASDCDCQTTLTHPDCSGHYACSTAGRCNWLCDPPKPCTKDAECAAGQVCGHDKACNSVCVTGCRVGSGGCPVGKVCAPQACSACGCENGVCVDSGTGCTDKDGDGWTAECKNSICPGFKGECDCDDGNANVHPLAAEKCGNGKDDDCDGVADDGCGSCSLGACARHLDCQPGTTYCDATAKCCTTCPMLAPPPCPPNQCTFSGGTASTGCPNPPVCAACCACPKLYAPVCGLNYGTYSSECEAKCAGVQVLHAGACLPGEGLDCTVGGVCAKGQYCRDVCPMCGALQQLRCTQEGVCVYPTDCPAGGPTLSCPNGPPTWTCSAQHQCSGKCP